MTMITVDKWCSLLAKLDGIVSRANNKAIYALLTLGSNERDYEFVIIEITGINIFTAKIKCNRVQSYENKTICNDIFAIDIGLSDVFDIQSVHVLWT